MRRYCITNWSEYNTALIERGNINIWFSKDAIKKWLHKGKRSNGRPKIFFEEAILMALIVKETLRMVLRMLEGFLASMMSSLGLKSSNTLLYTNLPPCQSA